MKTIHYLFQPVKKFCKGCIGLTALYAILATCVFIFDSCKKSNPVLLDGGKARTKFLSALKTYKSQIGSVKLMSARNLNDGLGLSTNISSFGKVSNTNDTTISTIDPVYLDFPAGTSQENKNMVSQITSIQQLSNLQNATNAVIQYSSTPNNSAYEVQLRISALNSSLNPLIEESKQYLYAKGLSEQDIQEMIVEHNGKTEDLVPFVMSLTNAEVQPDVITRNYLTPFANTANAKLDANDYLMCAIVAIGADVAYSLATSNVKTWSKALIKKAFGTVAKRFLGPVGVAIAVVSFGVCLAERND